jgi:hypothetical protein
VVVNYCTRGMIEEECREFKHSSACNSATSWVASVVILEIISKYDRKLAKYSTPRTFQLYFA